MNAYAGPLHDEPPAIELHNTLYAAGGDLVDGLAAPGSSDAWLRGLGERLPPGGTGSEVAVRELTGLREAVRRTLAAALGGALPAAADLAGLNAASARGASFPVVRRAGARGLVGGLETGAATRADVVVAALARDAIALLTGPHRDAVHACGAPGCVLLYLRSHPRQGWCSGACGNRARQARHYRRSRAAGRDAG